MNKSPLEKVAKKIRSAARTGRGTNLNPEDVVALVECGACSFIFEKEAQEIEECIKTKRAKLPQKSEKESSTLDVLNLINKV